MNTNLIEINGSIDSWGWQRSNVKWKLGQYKDQDVTVRISSYGGDVNEAMKISQLFYDHGKVTVQFLGMVASAVTWMAYGANKVQIAEDALWLCHKTSTVCDIYEALNADEIDAKIEELQKCKKTNEALDLIIAKKYADKSGSSIKDMLDLMKDEKWLTAKEAKKKCLVDEIIKPSGSIKNCHDMIIQNCADMKLPVPTFLPEQKDNIFDAIIDKCRELFQPKVVDVQHPLGSAEDDGEGNIVDEATVTEQPTEDPKNINNIILPMNKNFTLINSLLNVEGFEENEGKFVLTNEQMTAICNALQEKQTATDSLDKVASILDSIEENKSITGVDNKAQSLVNLVNRVPAMLAGTPLQSAEPADDIIEGADPINDIAKSFKN